jgi:hypothetical protein
MTLLANGFRDTLGAYQIYGATQSNNAYPSAGVANYARTAATRNLTAGQGITDDTVALPSGNRHPSAWMMPQKPGALASRNSVTGTGGMTDADIWAVKLAEAALVGQGDLSAIGSLIVQAIADLTGTGEITDADVKAFLAAVASLTGSGTVSAADLEGFGAVLAAVSGSGTLAGSTLTGVGELDADLVVTGTGLTTANVGQSVWAAIASANNTAGTMGEKLNDAGSASNPWTEVIESGYTAAEILRLLAAVAQGDATGLEGAAPVFKSIDGSKNRIEATYTAGTRTVTDRDAT